MKQAFSGDKLRAVQRDLAEAERRLAELVVGEGSATASAASYTDFLSERSAASAEVSRLKIVVEQLSAQADAAQAAAAASRQAALEEEAEREASAAATIVLKNIAKMTELARSTLEVIAKADIKIMAAQKGRSDDLSPLVGVEVRCRAARHPRNREVVVQTNVSLWVYAENRDVVLNEETARLVESADGHSGYLTAPFSGQRTKVVRRDFRRIEYRNWPAHRIQHLATALSIPGAHAGDRPGWRPLETYNPAAVLDALERLALPPDEPDNEVSFEPVSAFNSKVD